MLTRDEGIDAIIYLQSLVGIDEPRDVAGTNWDSFTDLEKEKTEAAYKMLSGANN